MPGRAKSLRLVRSTFAMDPTLQFLRAWQPNTAGLAALFTPEECKRLDLARRAAGKDKRVVAYCVFENPFARAGGVFAVATHLPPALRAAGDETVIITPFHRNLETTPGYDQVKHLGGIQVPFTSGTTKAELFETFDGSGNRWVYVQSWGVFDSRGGTTLKDPYAYDNSQFLTRDALFLSNSVPVVLAHLGLSSNVVVHAQDWQLAATALSVKQALLSGVLQSAATVLTSHNPYDQGLPDDSLSWITRRLGPNQWPFGSDTFYERMIPLTDVPLSTVSPGFALEMTSDPLQRRHFTGHLQTVYAKHGVVGINNPLFGEPKPAFSEEAAREATGGAPEKILAEKSRKRQKMLEVLSAYEDPRIGGGLDGGPGKKLTELPPEVPVFLMFGRLDPRQKGFDLFARAIEGVPRNAAKFILTPIVGPGTEEWATDLMDLAERRKGDVVMYPFRMEHGYMEAQAGATFAVMPSFYEPFGAATEAYLAGTPVIARATGGLTGQVVDHDEDKARATGFLFKEKLPLGASWPAIASAGPDGRIGVPLYVGMAEALYDSLRKAAAVYAKRPTSYGRMLANLYPKAETFSGERAAAGYQALYDLAVIDEPRF
jgi:glycogen synthase